MPKKGEFDARLEVRLSSATKAAIEDRAKAAGMKPSDFMRGLFEEFERRREDRERKARERQ